MPLITLYLSNDELSELYKQVFVSKCESIKEYLKLAIKEKAERVPK